MLNIKIVGGGCATCQKLEQLCREVVEENKILVEIEKITDLNKFTDLGIMMTPGLILNNKVVSSGKLPTKDTLFHWVVDVHN